MHMIYIHLTTEVGIQATNVYPKYTKLTIHTEWHVNWTFALLFQSL